MQNKASHIHSIKHREKNIRMVNLEDVPIPYAVKFWEWLHIAASNIAVLAQDQHKMHKQILQLRRRHKS